MVDLVHLLCLGGHQSWSQGEKSFKLNSIMEAVNNHDLIMFIFIAIDSQSYNSFDCDSLDVVFYVRAVN